jgi:hypothetical protein
VAPVPGIIFAHELNAISQRPQNAGVLPQHIGSG